MTKNINRLHQTNNIESQHTRIPSRLCRRVSVRDIQRLKKYVRAHRFAMNVNGKNQEIRCEK